MLRIFFEKHRTRERTILFSRAFRIPAACFLLMATGLFAQTTGPEPGLTDPLGKPSRYTLFPDQSLLSFTPSAADASSLDLRLYRTDGANNTAPLSLANATLLSSQTWNPAPIVASAGRILTPNRDDVAYARRNGSSVEVGFVSQSPSTTTLLPGLADRLSQSTDFIAIATGDLDKVADAQFQNHDEVVVAYAAPATQYGSNSLNLAVLNYTNGATPVVTTLNTNGPPANLFQYGSANSNTGGVLPFDNVVSVAIGDFDNDGKNEIAVAYVGSRTAVVVETYRYVSNGNGGGTLQYVSGATGWQRNDRPLLGTISAKAGDFNGDGADELAVGWGYWQGNSLLPQSNPAATIFQFGGYAGLTPNSKITHYLPPISAPQLPRLDLAAGQFLFQPPGIQFGRRQLAVAWNDIKTQGIDVQAFSFANDLNSLTSLGGPISITAAGTSLPGPPLQQFSLVAGGFTGNSNPKQPTASLALSFWTGNPGTYWVHTLAVTPNKLSVVDRRTYATFGIDTNSRVPLVACDWDGKSVYLGAPVHLTIQNAVSTDFILEEPPKHSYYDERTNRVVTVTRLDRNNVHLSNQQTGAFSSKSTDHTDWTIGGSLSASAGGTVGVSQNFGIAKGSAQASLDVTVKGSYDYDQHQESYNSQYGSRGIDTTGQTDRDDYLKGRLQTFDIWRYRVYGIAQPAPQTNNFYDIILPGPATNFANGGLNFDWYQPIHENGNILSYPRALGKTAGNPYLPSDIGTFTLPNGSTGTGPQVPPELSYFDGTGTSTTLRYSSQVASGGSFGYSHTLAESLDIKAAATASAEIAGVKGEVRISGETEFHNSNNWGTATSSADETTNLTQITLNRSSGNPNVTYPFYPVVYSSEDGTIKMTFAVPNPAGQSLNNNGFQFWAGLYGGKPDPALNLVRRFQPPSNPNNSSDWTPNFLNNRKYMRGLFFRRAALNPVTRDYDFLTDSVTDGDTVRVEARVYNYSTGQAANNIPVVFQAIPYNSTTDSEICSTPLNGAPGANTSLLCPASARTTIGQITVPLLNPLQFTCLTGTDDPQVTGCAPSAFINWNTKGFGPSSKGTTQYRIYVVLDPNNTINQIYGGEAAPVPITNVTNASPMVVTTAAAHALVSGNHATIGNVQGLNGANGIFQVTYISPTSFSLNNTTPGPSPYSGGGTATIFDPGQNNEGFGYLDIAYNPGLNATENAGVSADNYLAADSVQAIDYRTAQLTGTGVTAYQGRPLQIRITAFSSVTQPYGARLLLYDGDPAQGAASIADKLIHPGNSGPDGTSVWIDWTPETTSVHQLYAQLQESPGDPQPGNNIAMLDVNVLRNGDINGDGQVNKADLNMLLSNVGKSVEDSSCGLLCDIDGDGRISVLDARKLILMCNTAGCAGQ